MKCQFCGAAIDQLPNGRPRLFCSSECRETSSYLTMVEQRLPTIRYHLDADAARSIRRRLWLAANLLNGNAA